VRPSVLAVATGIALLAVPSGAAAAMAPHLRPARPADIVMRPHSLSDVWTLRAQAPGSRDWVYVHWVREQYPAEPGVHASYFHDDEETDGGAVIGTAEATNGNRVRFASERETSSIALHGHGATLDFHGPYLSGRLRLSHALPGPAALGWRLTSIQHGPMTLNWSAPIATAKVTGSLTLAHSRVSLNGWRATLDHRWGRFLEDWDGWRHWETATIQMRGGALLLFGLTPAALATGPGARDAQWLGVLARTTPRGTHMCRPALRRRYWVLGDHFLPTYSERVSATCDHIRVQLRDAGDVRTEGDELWSGRLTRALAGDRVRALIEHLY
jgi:hypothetical protein